MELENYTEEFIGVRDNYEEYFKDKGLEISTEILNDLTRCYIANNTDFLDRK